MKNEKLVSGTAERLSRQSVRPGSRRGRWAIRGDFSVFTFVYIVPLLMVMKVVNLD